MLLTRGPSELLSKLAARSGLLHGAVTQTFMAFVHDAKQSQLSQGIDEDGGDW